MIYKTLLIALLAITPLCAIAQKAYETANYSGKVKGQNIALKLANGYIGASEVSLNTSPKKAPLLFKPESNAPDSNGQLIFRGDKPTAGYFILQKMKEAYDQLPVMIYGVFISGNQRLAVKLSLDKNKI